MRRLLLRASRSRFLRDRATRYRFAREAVARFMPGESAADALAATRSLADAGLATVLTRLGEDLGSLAEARHVAEHYHGLLNDIREQALPAEISVKPTQLGLDRSAEAAAANVAELVEAAGAAGNFVWIDMEGSAHIDATLELFQRARGAGANTGLCLQSYLFRTESDLESLLELVPAIRLVKGAYAEPASIAYRRKRDVDEAYRRLARRLLEATAAGRAVRPAFGTHDTRLIEALAADAQSLGIDRRAFEVQMLYGIRPDEQRRLAAAGFQVRVLISYGPSWFPWYMRRLAERPANLLFAVRALAKRGSPAT